MLRPYLNLPLSETNLVSPMVKDYLAKKESLKPFVGKWQDMVDLQHLIENRNFEESKRRILYAHLVKQYSNAGINLRSDSKVFANIENLKNEQTFTITTGHQLSLFGGTLFMSYKILTAIKLAAELQKNNPQKNVVPVLWLASEDHDFEEIQSTYLFGKKYVWEKDTQNKACGTIDLEGISKLIEEMKVVLGNTETAQNWIGQIENAYKAPYDLAAATLRFYHALFEDFGLLILDPNDKTLKDLFVKEIEADLLDQQNFKVQNPSDKLLGDTYKLQINARPYNFFYIDELLGRVMVKKEGDFWVCGSNQWNENDLRKVIKLSPEKFSPNVNLRPLYQETILPNLAYIGGPAEISYWMQLKPIFDVNGESYPVLAVRFMNVLLGNGFAEKVEKAQIKLTDLLLEEKTLAELYIHQSQGFDYKQKVEAVLTELQLFVDSCKNTAPNLSKAFLEQKLKMKDFFKDNSGDFNKAITKSEQAQIEKIFKLRAKLFPIGVFQERMETMLQQEVMAERNLRLEIFEILEPLSGHLYFTDI